MIEIAGNIQRSFAFPADLPTTFDYYCNLDRTLGFLTHIVIQDKLADGQYRLQYSSIELGVYEINILCDLRAEVERNEWRLIFHPLAGISQEEGQASLYSIRGHGNFTSESIFVDNGEQTFIKYKLTLRAKLPVPLGLRFMPKRVVNSIARNITQGRIEDIADQFIKRSIDSFA